MTITRSVGIDTGYMGMRAGGGYRGITDELDSIVAKAADLLAQEYGRDVEIRFNSDRLSGGAWIKDERTNNTTIGINAGLAPVRPPHTSDEEWIFVDQQTWDARPRLPYLKTRVYDLALRDETPRTEGSLSGNKYADVKHDTLTDAMEWLRRNVRPDVFSGP
mgnify:FL=1